MLAGDDKAVEQLVGLSASQQLSTADLHALLLQAITKATRASFDTSKWDSERRHESGFLRQQRDKVVLLLLGMQACRMFTPGIVCELLQACILHGVVSTARTLLQEPAGQQMDAGHLEQLLLTHLTQQARQHKNRAEVQQLLGSLLQHPAAAALDSAALSRLIAEHVPFAVAETTSRGRATNSELMRNELQRMGEATTKAIEGVCEFDPVELLVGLPAVQLYDAAGLAFVLAAAAEAHVSSKVLDMLCSAPGAAGLDTAQLRWLLGVCAQHYNADAFRRLLQHPAAPGRGDSQVQLYAGMLGC
jgi:hypothetical protein